jgi:hypothetical protein
MTKIGRIIMVVLSLSALVAGLSGCKKKKGPAERSGKEIDNAAEKAGQQIGKTVEKAGDKLEKAGEKLKNAAH